MVILEFLIKKGSKMKIRFRYIVVLTLALVAALSTQETQTRHGRYRGYYGGAGIGLGPVEIVAGYSPYSYYSYPYDPYDPYYYGPSVGVGVGPLGIWF
jgi:hypothetical protein